MESQQLFLSYAIADVLVSPSGLRYISNTDLLLHLVAEKTFKQIRQLAHKTPEVNFVAVSHSDQESTDKWIISIGGQWEVQVIVDADRELYAKYGLGASSAWHVLNPWSMYSVYKLGKAENIWNKPTESGNRWQTSGNFAVDKDGVMKWSKVAQTADDIPNFTDALKALGIEK